MNFFTSRTLGALLVLITVAAYIPAISAGFIWDDDTLLTANPQMRTSAGLAQIWRGEHSRDYTPLTLTSFWLEWQLWRNTPTGYHVINILLHAFAAVLLWMVLRKLRVPWAWLGALLFAIHPVNVASVAWVAERKNTLSMAFFLGAILSYLTWREGKSQKLYIASIGLFLLAGLSKGAVVTLPAILILCVSWKERRLNRKDWLELIPFGIISAIVALLTITFQARAQHYGLVPDTWTYRIARAGMAIWDYLAALFWPAGLSPMRAPWLPNLSSPSAYLPAAGVIILIGIFLWKRKTWGRAPLLAAAYYLIMLLPVLGFVWMTLMQETPSADWWQYLAAPGIFACVAGGLEAAGNRKFVIPFCIVIIALLIIRTWQRSAIYDSMESYCRAVTAEDPHAYTLENNLGILLKREGYFADAESCFRQALIDNPGYVEAHVNMANSYRSSWNLGAAEWELRTAIQMRPGDPQILDNLTGLLFAEGRKQEALALESDAVKAAPGNFLLTLKLCEMLVADGKRDEALRLCTRVDELARTSGDANAINMANSLRQECEAAVNH